MRPDGSGVIRWEGDQVRRGDARLGEEIRRNRKLAGFTQGAVAREFGISPKTVGKWERGQAFPSPRNILALRKSGLLDPGPDGRDGAKRKRPQAVSPELVERAMARLGAETSDLLTRVGSFRDDGERALVALFRTLSVAQQEAVLEITGAMEPAAAAAGTAAEEGEEGPNREEGAVAARGT